MMNFVPSFVLWAKKCHLSSRGPTPPLETAQPASLSVDDESTAIIGYNNVLICPHNCPHFFSCLKINAILGYIVHSQRGQEPPSLNVVQLLPLHPPPLPTTWTLHPLSQTLNAKSSSLLIAKRNRWRVKPRPLSQSWRLSFPMGWVSAVGLCNCSYLIAKERDY